MSFLFEIIAGLFNSIGQDTSLNTKKIDSNIKKLSNYDWFKNLYEDERYHRLFLVNRRIRGYLQSTYRVKRMIKHEKSRDKLKKLLAKEING